jgi:hypothetical protein
MALVWHKLRGCSGENIPSTMGGRARYVEMTSKKSRLWQRMAAIVCEMPTDLGERRSFGVVKTNYVHFILEATWRFRKAYSISSFSPQCRSDPCNFRDRSRSALLAKTIRSGIFCRSNSRRAILYKTSHLFCLCPLGNMRHLISSGALRKSEMYARQYFKSVQY